MTIAVVSCYSVAKYMINNKYLQERGKACVLKSCTILGTPKKSLKLMFSVAD